MPASHFSFKEGSTARDLKEVEYLEKGLSMHPEALSNTAEKSSWDSDPGWAIYKQMDGIRRAQGRLFDLLGFGPAETPYRVVFQRAGVTLRAYGADDETLPVLLIVPATIKRAYIWDLAPWASVVRLCLHSGVRVFFIQWDEHEGDCRKLGLSEYADRFILECMEVIRAETGTDRAFLVGHSLGGTFAAIFSSLHPELTQGLILLGSPLNFGRDAGDVPPMVLSSPRAQLLTARWGDVPGSFVSLTSSLASPETFLWSRWMDWLACLPDAQARRTHLRVIRWMHDEMPFCRKLFQEIVELLYRENRFLAGRLEVGGRRAMPEQIEAPILSVIDPRCRVAPPESMLPFFDAVRSTDKKTLLYEGDIGVAIQHLGMLVGKRSHQFVWPKIVKWIHAHAEGASTEPGANL